MFPISPLRPTSGIYQKGIYELHEVIVESIAVEAKGKTREELLLSCWAEPSDLDAILRELVIGDVLYVDRGTPPRFGLTEKGYDIFILSTLSIGW